MSLTENRITEDITSPKGAKKPVAAGAIEIFDGAYLALNANRFAVLGVDTAAFIFGGIAIEHLDQATGGSDGDNDISVKPAGSGSWVKMNFTNTITRANEGDTVYLVDDETVGLVADVSNNVEVGKLQEFIDSLTGMVQIT